MAGPNVPVGTTVVSNALKPTLEDVWGDQKMTDLDWMGCGYKVSNTTDAYVDDQEYAHTNAAPAVPEGQLIPVDSIVQGYAKRYWMVKYALRLVVTEEALDDCKYEDAINGTASIARSLRLTQEYQGASTFIYAFTSGYNGGDLKSLCATDHPLPKGGSTSNMFSTAMSFSETAVEQMAINMSKIPASNGEIQAGYDLVKLVLPKEYKFQAIRILKSQQQNDTANNAINALKSENISYACNRYFTSTTNWFGTSDVPAGLKWIWRKKPLFRPHSTEDNYTKSFVGLQRFQLGWSDWRDVYGSNF